MSPSREVTELLRDWSAGSPQALSQLMPLVYDELRRLSEAVAQDEQRDLDLLALDAALQRFSQDRFSARANRRAALFWGVDQRGLIREIGRGSMGTVFLGSRADELFNKLVAFKLINRGMHAQAIAGDALGDAARQWFGEP